MKRLILTTIAVLTIFSGIINPNALAKTLIIDDDGGKNTENWLIAILKNNDISHQVHSVKDMGYPSLDSMKNFKQIIWHSGGYNGAIMDWNQKNTIKKYLEDGGNILFLGSGIGKNLDEGPYGSFLTDIFSLNFSSSGQLPLRMEGDFSSPITNGRTYKYSGKTDIFREKFSDHRNFIDNNILFCCDNMGKKAITSATAERRAYPPYFRAAIMGFELNLMENHEKILLNSLSWLNYSPREKAIMLADITKILDENILSPNILEKVRLQGENIFEELADNLSENPELCDDIDGLEEELDDPSALEPVFDLIKEAKRARELFGNR